MQTKLSIVVQHYNSWPAVERHLAIRAQLPSEILAKTELIIVDDGSTDPWAERSTPPNTVIVRINENIPWNQPGARNLGVSLARSEWLLVSDIDYTFPTESIAAMLESLPLSNDCYYRIKRLSGKGTFNGKSHMNTFVISRAAFDSIGGADEDFSGSYGCDDANFEQRWLENKNRIDLHPTAFSVFDSNAFTRGFDRDTSRNMQLYLERKNAGQKINTGPRLRFTWQTISDQRLAIVD